MFNSVRWSVRCVVMLLATSAFGELLSAGAIETSLSTFLPAWNCTSIKFWLKEGTRLHTIFKETYLQLIFWNIIFNRVYSHNLINYCCSLQSKTHSFCFFIIYSQTEEDACSLKMTPKHNFKTHEKFKLKKMPIQMMSWL